MFIIKRALRKMLFSQKSFELFQKFGVNLTRNHFYSPIPDTKVLKANKKLWEEEMKLVGVDLNIEKQLSMLKSVFPMFQEEYDFPLNKTSTPHEYYINNGAFGFVSASVLHATIRHFTPRTIIEVGSGNSTYVSARASMMNIANGQPTKLISIEPYPNQVLKEGFPGLSELIPKKAEEVGANFFAQLEDGDILFIDSSAVSNKLVQPFCMLSFRA